MRVSSFVHAVERIGCPAPDDGTLAGAMELLTMDVCRWVRPEEVADRSEVNLLVIAKLLYRHPPLRAMAWFRLATLMHRRKVKLVPGILQRRLLRLYGLELVPGARIGGGLYIAHPVGCVIVVEFDGHERVADGQRDVRAARAITLAGGR